MEKLLVFDFDGVIADSLETIIKVSAHACKNINHPRLLTKEDVCATDNMVLEELARKIEISEHQMPEFLGEIFALLPEYAEEFEPVKGMPQVLRELALKNKVAIVTANAGHLVDAFLERQNLSNLDFFIMGECAKGAKREKILHICRLSGIDPSKTVFVGDTVSDIWEAGAAGVECVVVSWGYHDEERLLAEQPMAVVRSPAELLDILTSKE